MDRKLEEIKNENGKYSVYLLDCKDTPNVVYIGITNNTYVIQRLFKHFEESVSNTSKNEEKHKWILNNWRNINMTIIESNIDSDEIARLREAYWVFEYKKKDMKVLNMTYVAIRCYDAEGKFYKDYASYAEAAKDFDVLPSRIMQCVSENNRKLFKEFSFVKWEKNLPTSIKIEKHNANTLKTHVLQYSLDGYFIKEWESPLEACENLFIDRSQMTRCLKDFSKTAKNFHFLYKGRTIDTYIYPYDKIKVVMYDLQGNELGKFKSVKACAQVLIDEGLTTATISNVGSSISKMSKQNKPYLNRIFTVY